MFNSQDFDACAEIAAETYIEHARAPFGESSPGEVNGPKHLHGGRRAGSWRSSPTCT